MNKYSNSSFSSSENLYSFATFNIALLVKTLFIPSLSNPSLSSSVKVNLISSAFFFAIFSPLILINFTLVFSTFTILHYFLKNFKEYF